MAINNIEELKVGLCCLLGLPIPPADSANYLADGQTAFTLKIDDVCLTVAYSETIRNDRAFIFCSYGEAPADLELFILRRLLETNFILYRGNTPSFSRDPASGHIMLQAELVFAQTNPEHALQIMKQFAEHVTQWHKTHFIEDFVNAGAVQSSTLAEHVAAIGRLA
jgi:hypothetical protein